MLAFYRSNKKELACKNRWLLSGLIPGIALLLVGSISTAYACEIRLEGLDDITLDISRSNSYIQRSDIGQTLSDMFKVTGNGETCRFFVTFSGNSPARYLKGPDGSSLLYGLYDSVQRHNPLLGLPAAENNVLAGEHSRKQPVRTLRYYFFTALDETAMAGTYQDMVQVKLYEGDLNNFILRDSKMVLYTVLVPTSIDIKVRASGGNSAVLDFGSLEPGEGQSFTAEVITNIPYDLSIQSENRGALKHQSGRIPGRINYTLTHAGKVVDLSETSHLAFPQRKKKLQVDMLDFNITIDDFEFVLRGEYQDSLLLTVTAR